MENFGVIIFKSLFLGLTSLKEVKQCISYNISFFLMIIYLEVVSREVLDSADLARAQALYIHQLTGVIIVNKNKNLVFATF